MKKNEQVLLQQLQINEMSAVYFGPQGFSFASDESALEEMQQGFAVDSDGNSLVGAKAGQWQGEWVAFALDTEMGDPYFVDISCDTLPVYTAFYAGQGWEVTQVAQSFEAFLQCLAYLVEQAPQSQVVFVPDHSCLSDETRLKQLESHLALVSGCQGFWQEFFACYLDWLKED